MRNAFDRIRLAVRKVVHRIDAPTVARSMVAGVHDAVQHGIAHVQIGVGHVHLGAQRSRTVRKLALPHAFEQRQVFFDASVAVGAVPTWRGECSAILTDLITRPVILTAEKLFNTTPIERSEEEQATIDEQTRSMAMYEFRACPYCVKTRRALKRLNLKIECRDALNNQEYKQELTTQGGKFQVPCLRISHGEEDRWMYESSDIIKYLDQRFGSAAS